VGAIAFEPRRLGRPSGDAGGDAGAAEGAPGWRPGGRDRGGDAGRLAAAEATLKERDGGLARVQRHLSTLGGRPALQQEADQAANHGWAYVTCAGKSQHWLTSPAARR